jgi:hypothetical protein
MNYKEQFKEFEKIQHELLNLSIRKNHDYGPENIGALGERGIYVRIWDKVARLKTLLWDNKDPAVKDESIDDTIRDLANYAIIMLVLRRGKWGK